MGVTGPEHSAAVRMWRGRAVWHAAALPALAIGLGCKPSNPLLWGTHVLQQADLYAHLDLNRAPGHSPLRTTFPIATELTLVRAYAAAALLAGSATPRRALMLGMATDLLDGYAARRSASETQLGAWLDAEYDAYLLLAAARAARRRGGLQRWAERLVWLRFGGVLLAGSLAPRPVTVRSTWPGKVANGIQAATAYSALATTDGRVQRWQSWAMGIGTALGVGAQVARLWTPRV